MTNNIVDKERYNRQIILKGFGMEAQQKIALAKVLVIGAGGLGCPALQYLAAAGVGAIGIADHDVVSLSNLHRQTLYSTGDIGLPKVTTASERLRLLNPAIIIHAHNVTVHNNNALGIIGQYDYVMDGTDNFASRYMISDACALLKKPLFYGAVSQYEGQVAIFNVADTNGHTTSYRDIFPHPPKVGEVPNCAEAGVLGVLPGIIGTMLAAEAIKLITGIGDALVNKLLTYNLLTNEVYTVTITPSKNNNPAISEAAFLQMDYNTFCNTQNNTVIEIDGNQLGLLRKQPSTVVIDVREKGELPLVRNFDHRQIPMSVFKNAMGGISEQNIILFCQHGIRSLHAGEMLQEIFGTSKKLYSLKGGVNRWADELL